VSTWIVPVTPTIRHCCGVLVANAVYRSPYLLAYLRALLKLSEWMAYDTAIRLHCDAEQVVRAVVLESLSNMNFSNFVYLQIDHYNSQQLNSSKTIYNSLT